MVPASVKCRTLEPQRSTHRTQVDRLLNPKSSITLSSLQRAAARVERRRMIELV
jgi:hypothetical protein